MRHKDNPEVRFYVRRADYLDRPEVMPTLLEIRAPRNLAFEAEDKPAHLAHPAGVVDHDAFVQLYERV